MKPPPPWPPAPEHCLDHPDDAGWGYGGLQQLGDLDTEVGVLLHGDLDQAQARQNDYMNMARQLHSRHGSARALYFRGEAHRSKGSLDYDSIVLKPNNDSRDFHFMA